MLDPVLLSAISDLEFVARVTVEGALSGLHRSPFHGYSAEFSQYRHYRAGDDLKYVDWKLFARTDRIYTKQFRETTNVRMQVVLDASASMAYRSDAGASKLEYARLLGAALTHLIAGQGDATGLTVYDDQIRSYLASRPGRTHLRAVLAQLANTRPHGKTASAGALRRAIDLLRSRGVLVLISDLLENENADADAVHAELRRASRMGHDVSVFHVLTPDELEWRWAGDLELEDSESGRRVLSAAAAGPEYKRRVEAFVEGWRIRCTNAGIEYVLARTDAAPAHTLREYLLHRGHGALR